MAKSGMRFPSKADVMARTPDPAVREMLVHLEQAGIETVLSDLHKPTQQVWR
ncbi:hypothetical protein [uncultured Thiodictyon sp.]|jgi:carbon-monoxide dehydrogenase catalytic subunit|uniref:hypothetical protein n=1 Tax=uncultured Thiodictyon sp. TaxID=1846217 RepID=UPI0025D82B91|nr:hypothetical protein [uncultured Thiodictyon sp.]